MNEELKNAGDFITDNWGVLVPIVYEVGARVIPTEKNRSLLDLIVRIIGVLLKNRRKKQSTDETPSQDSSINKIVVDRTKHIVYTLLFLLSFGASIAQTNGTFKSIRSYNADSLTVQTEISGLQLMYGNVGGMYYNTISGKWRCYSTALGWYDCLGTSGGVPTLPAGSDTEIQYNNSGSFGASSNFTFNSSTQLNNLIGTMNIGTGLNSEPRVNMFTEDRLSHATPTNGGLRIRAATGTNVATSFGVSPRGTGASATYKGAIAVWNTDFFSDPVNYEIFVMGANGTAGYNIVSEIGGTGTRRSITIDAANVTSHTSPTAAKQLIVASNGSVGINGAPSANYNMDITSPTLPSIRMNSTAVAGVNAGAIMVLTGSTPTAADHRLGVITFGNRNGSANTNSSYLEVKSTQAHTVGVSEGSDFRFLTTPNGTASPTEKFRFGSQGQLGIGGANYGTVGQALMSGGSSAAPSWASPFTLTTTGSSGAATYSAGTLNIPQYSGGSTSPAGATTEVQYNNAGAFGANAGMTFVSASEQLRLGNTPATNGVIITGLAASNPNVNVRQSGLGGASLSASSLGFGGNATISSSTGTLDISSVGSGSYIQGANTNLSIGNTGPGTGDVIINTASSTGSYLFITNLPTSCSGVPTGAIANVAGVLTVCP